MLSFKGHIITSDPCRDIPSITILNCAWFQCFLTRFRTSGGPKNAPQTRPPPLAETAKLLDELLAMPCSVMSRNLTDALPSYKLMTYLADFIRTLAVSFKEKAGVLSASGIEKVKDLRPCT